MKPEIRVYGECSGMLQAELEDMNLPFDSVVAEHDSVTIEHEGMLVEDIDESIGKLQRAMSPQGKGWLDVIDNASWTMSRYTLTKTGFQVVHHDVDNFLDRFRYYE